MKTLIVCFAVAALPVLAEPATPRPATVEELQKQNAALQEDLTLTQFALRDATAQRDAALAHAAFLQAQLDAMRKGDKRVPGNPQ